MQTLSREETKDLINDDVTVVEVLGADNYNDYHLPGAVNVPLGERFDEQIQQVVPDKSTPVLVYCYDSDCDASPKAARRLEKLGYETVYDYEAGKVDWKQAGLPVEK
jgi:rhodanese-related sulfurtransferase